MTTLCQFWTFSISIHALREEGDPTMAAGWTTTSNFYPRPPRGGRRALAFADLSVYPFLSTPSARRATRCSIVFLLSFTAISIHALREEGDFFKRP